MSKRRKNKQRQTRLSEKVESWLHSQSVMDHTGKTEGREESFRKGLLKRLHNLAINYQIKLKDLPETILYYLLIGFLSHKGYSTKKKLIEAIKKDKELGDKLYLAFLDKDGKLLEVKERLKVQEFLNGKTSYNFPVNSLFDKGGLNTLLNYYGRKLENWQIMALFKEKEARLEEEFYEEVLKSKGKVKTPSLSLEEDTVYHCGRAVTNAHHVYSLTDFLTLFEINLVKASRRGKYIVKDDMADNTVTIYFLNKEDTNELLAFNLTHTVYQSFNSYLTLWQK